MELGTHDWCHLVTDTHTHTHTSMLSSSFKASFTIFYILKNSFKICSTAIEPGPGYYPIVVRVFISRNTQGSACRCQHSVIKSNLRMFTKLMSKGHFLYYWLIVHVWCGSNDWSSLQHVWSIFQNISSLLTKINGEDH